MNKNYLSMKFSDFVFKILIVGSVVLFSGCLSVKGVKKTGKKLFETFFVGEDGTQYFIKPLTFKGVDKDQLLLDVTFRYKDKIKDSAIVNVSLLSNEMYRNIDSLKISTDSTSIILNNIKYLFADINKKEFNSRFTTKATVANISKLFDSNNWNIVVYKQDKKVKYTTPTATKRKVNGLKSGIFALL